jgi:RNA polymerase sigma-70 factor (ECF subfamily)
MIEDKLLIWRFKCGSTDALCRIYRKYKNNLLKLATALLNETSVAEDVVQDVFVSFAQSAEKIKLTGNLKSYLATCVANRVRNWNCARKHQEAANPDEAELAVSNSKRPEQWLIYNEQLRRLNNALSLLPYEQREAVSLHAQGGMKFKAIAELQDVSINTVQSRYRYGLDKLRSILDGEAKL